MARALVSLAVCSFLGLLCGTARSAPSQATSAAQVHAAVAPYQDPKLPVEKRLDDLLGRMTAVEKARLLAGSGWMESFPIERLGIPAIKMADGPMGVRNWIGSSAITNLATTPPVLATAFPASVGMAASFDVDLVQAEGRAIAQEVKALGRDMILAPTVNIQRTPLWGRNFEGYGEDPYLAARMAVAYIRGVQGEGVIPSVKHFAANNQEFERHRIDEEIDPRTLHEIYFPAFRAAVQEAGVWAVMSAYNEVNGQYCAESPFLLTDTLKKRWGFQGFVISDWGSTYSTAGTVSAGMDLEMPGGEPMRRWFSRVAAQQEGRGRRGWLTEDKVMAAVASGALKQSAVDDNARRILRVMFDRRPLRQPRIGGGEVDTPEQRAVARRAATESMVLLRNEGAAPPAGRAPGALGGGDRAERGGGTHGRRRQLARAPEVRGDTAPRHPRGRGRPGPGALRPGGRHARRGGTGGPPSGARGGRGAGRSSDVAVVVVGYSFKLESEGFDRPSMDLPAGQDELIEAVAAANKNTIVVVVAGAPVTMTRWLERVPAVLYAWYGGQEAGHAIGDLLFGAAAPSGKLPATFPRRIEDSTAFGHYPGEKLHVAYAEGIYVGYRGFDKEKVEPLFPFGFGLSYTTFAYSGLRIETPKVKVGRAGGAQPAGPEHRQPGGAEVVQLYLRDVAASLDRPLKELKGFERISLQPGETKTVRFTLDQKAMSFFDPGRDDWVAEPGAFEVEIGASSRDIRLRGGFELVD